MDCRNSPDCGQAGLPAEGSLMRRPLFMACLCLVIVLTIGRILTGADTGDAGVLPPDGSPVRITGRIDTRTSETIILKSISIIQNDLKYSYSGKLQCELTNTQEVQSLRLGQHIVLEGVFSHFDAATNHGEFDVRAYSAGKGIGGRVRKAQVLAAEEDYSFLREKLFAFRRRLHDRLAKVFPEKEASVMQTLLLGEKEELDADSNAVSSFVVNNFLTIGLNVVLVVLICIILFSINPVFLVLSACSLVAYFILFRALKKPLYNSSLANKEGLSKLFASVSGELSQLFDIKCDGAYDQSARTLKGVFEGYYPIYMKASRVSNLATSSDGLISSVFRGALLVISGMEILSRRMSIGEFTMVNSYYSMAFGCFKYYLNYFKSYQDARASFDRLGALTEDAEDRGTLTVGHVESISLSNIAYRYAGKPYLYRDLSVDVERGKPMPLPGRTDAAKARF